MGAARGGREPGSGWNKFAVAMAVATADIYPALGWLVTDADPAQADPADNPANETLVRVGWRGRCSRIPAERCEPLSASDSD